jgi:hypothetical protein
MLGNHSSHLPAVILEELMAVAERWFAESPFANLPTTSWTFSAVKKALTKLASGARERAVLFLGPPGGKSFIPFLFDHAVA